MPYFDFENLINRYSKDFEAILVSDGHYNDKGDYIDGKKIKISTSGAIVNLKQSKIYRSEGNLTSKDLRLFLLKPIENALGESYLIYKRNKYRIESETENAEFTGIYAYTLKYVSAFCENEVDE